MNTRETREITFTVDGVDHKAEIYTFLTGFEKQEMTKIMSAGAVINANNPDGTELGGEAVLKGQDYLIKTLIASINGVRDNVYQTLMSMHSDAYDAISTEINTVMASWGKKKA